VQLKELDAVTAPADADAAADQFDALTTAARKLAEEIRQHKLKNADKAAEAWHNRMMQAVSDTQPATQENRE
jgi:cytochrome c1